MASPKKIPLVIERPPKRISEMTDAERRDFAGKLFEQIAESHSKRVPRRQRSD